MAVGAPWRIQVDLSLSGRVRLHFQLGTHLRTVRYEKVRNARFAGNQVDSAQYITANRLIKFLKYFVDMDDKFVPCNSLLREFIGGSCFAEVEE